LGNGIQSFRWFTTERMNSLGRIRSDTLALNIGALSGLSTYLIHSFFDFNLHIPANALLLAIVFAILANPGVDLPFKSARFHKTNRYLRLALPALALWLALAGLPTLRAEYFAEQARLAFGRDDFATTVKAANTGISFDHRNPFLYWYLGQGYFAMGETAPNSDVGEVFFKLSEQAYRKSLPLFPQDRYLLLGMGWSLDALKRFDEAEPYFKEVVAAETNSAQIRAFYAIHLHSAGKLDEAGKEYTNSMKLYGNLAAQRGLERLAQERKRGQ
jgi:tetratricopeptide (TPR) repeat protein